MQIKINGKSQEVDNKTSLFTFLEQSGIPPATTIVTLNGNPLSIDQYKTIILKEQDDLEFFSFVGGG